MFETGTMRATRSSTKLTETSPTGALEGRFEDGHVICIDHGHQCSGDPSNAPETDNVLEVISDIESETQSEVHDEICPEEPSKEPTAKATATSTVDSILLAPQPLKYFF